MRCDINVQAHDIRKGNNQSDPMGTIPARGPQTPCRRLQKDLEEPIKTTETHKIPTSDNKQYPATANKTGNAARPENRPRQAQPNKHNQRVQPEQHEQKTQPEKNIEQNSQTAQSVNLIMSSRPNRKHK